MVPYEASRPGVDGRDVVGGGGLPLLAGAEDVLISYLFQRVGEAFQLRGAIELGAVDEAPRPGVDGRDGVGGGGFPLLVHAVVARHGAVRRLRLHGAPVRAHQHRRHHAERPVALRETVARVTG